ncbi:fibronectin type III domain-containing protein [Paenibacillus catalpae]|uniref:fibronectin type III domain-containing protein n=1 Tax=Paenibacillus catalpae TaxID=1045775 RepID=UPI000AC7D685|nr:fibronectin type III domain-containing protein [Paenibacillus catalpae]
MNVRRKLGLCVSVLLIMMSLFPLAAGAASGGNGKGSKVIVQLAASYVTAFEAEITAVIGKGYSPRLYIGTDPASLTLSQGKVSRLANQYRFYVTDLKPQTTYYYQVEALSGKKTEKSKVQTFTTLQEALVISGIQAYSTNSTFTKFEWSTNHGATSTLYYGIDPSTLDQTAATAQDGNTLHLAYADQLKPGTTYYYQVVAKDDYGNYAERCL